MSTTRLSFKHFLLTRYAVIDKAGALDIKLTPEWFEKRLELFARHTLRTVRAQSTQNFTWLIFFSSEVVREMYPAMNLCVDMPNCHFTPINRGDWSDCNCEMRMAIMRNLANETHIITTRLDNDDEIAPDFMQIVQNQFAGQAFTFVNFDKGLILTKAGALEMHRDNANMFQSLIEARGFSGIFSWQHGNTPRVGPVIRIKDQGKWTHVFHSGNAGRYKVLNARPNV